MTPLVLHTPRRTIVIRPRSPAHRAKLVREAAMHDGWAYATMRSAPGVRVVVESAAPGFAVGDAHMDLDIYRVLELDRARASRRTP